MIRYRVSANVVLTVLYPIDTPSACAMEQKRTVYDNLSKTIICMLPIKANVLNHHDLRVCRFILLRSSYPLVFQRCLTCLGPMQALLGSTVIGVTMRLRIVLARMNSFVSQVVLASVVVYWLISRKS